MDKNSGAVAPLMSAQLPTVFRIRSDSYIMKKTKTLLLALLSAGVLASTAYAAAVPAPIKMVENTGMTVVKEFPAASGLHGWVLAKNGQYSMVFTTPDGKTLIAGALVDATGHNMTADYANKYIPKPDLDKLSGELKTLPYAATGTLKAPKSVIYVMYDANCIFCHLAWKALKPYEAEGLQVRWVPVSFLKPTSIQRAYAIMSAKDPTAAFEENEVKFDEQSENGGITPAASVPPAFMAKIQADDAFMSRVGSRGTPTVLYFGKDKHLHVVPGMPRLSQLPEITGLPAVANHDPELARFQ